MVAENSLEKRMYPRVEARIPVAYQIRETGERGSSICHNISEGGTQMLATGFLPINKNLLMQIFLNEKPARMIHTVARVVWNEQVPYAEKYRIGLEFVHISDEAKKIILDFIGTRV